MGGWGGCLSFDTLVIRLITQPPGRPPPPKTSYPSTHLRVSSSSPDLTLSPPPLLCCRPSPLFHPSRTAPALPTLSSPSPVAVQQGQAGHCVLICNPLPFVSSPGPGRGRGESGEAGAPTRGECPIRQLSHTQHTHTVTHTSVSRRGGETGWLGSSDSSTPPARRGLRDTGRNHDAAILRLDSSRFDRSSAFK